MDITKLQDLFKQMTREEKIGQTVQLTGNFYDDDTAAITGPMKEMNVSANDLTRVGSILGGTGAADIRRIQDDYMKKKPSRHSFVIYGGRYSRVSDYFPDTTSPSQFMEPRSF